MELCGTVKLWLTAMAVILICQAKQEDSQEASVIVHRSFLGFVACMYQNSENQASYTFLGQLNF